MILNMVIKAGNEAKAETIIVMICLTAFLIIYIIEQAFTVVLLVGCISLILLVPRWMVTFKTIIMDRNGCTVHMLWYKKTYRWDELKTKRYVIYSGKSYEARSFPTSGAEFPPKIVDRSIRKKSLTYSAYHPFSFFFVYFPQNPRGSAPLYFEVNEDIFRAKMKEWHVEMEEVKE